MSAHLTRLKTNLAVVQGKLNAAAPGTQQWKVHNTKATHIGQEIARLEGTSSLQATTAAPSAMVVPQAPAVPVVEENMQPQHHHMPVPVAAAANVMVLGAQQMQPQPVTMLQPMAMMPQPVPTAMYHPAGVPYAPPAVAPVGHASPHLHHQHHASMTMSGTYDSGQDLPQYNQQHQYNQQPQGQQQRQYTQSVTSSSTPGGFVECGNNFQPQQGHDIIDHHRAQGRLGEARLNILAYDCRSTLTSIRRLGKALREHYPQVYSQFGFVLPRGSPFSPDFIGADPNMAFRRFFAVLPEINIEGKLIVKWHNLVFKMGRVLHPNPPADPRSLDDLARSLHPTCEREANSALAAGLFEVDGEPGGQSTSITFNLVRIAGFRTERCSGCQDRTTCMGAHNEAELRTAPQNCSEGLLFLASEELERMSYVDKTHQNSNVVHS